MKIVLAALSLILSTHVAQALEVGSPAPCVVLNHVEANGSESEHCIREPEHAGKPVVIEFFSAVCSDCQRNLPIFSALSRELRGEATFRFVGVDRDEALLRRYIQQHRDLIDFSVALDTNRDAKRAYHVVATPTLYILSPENVILYRHQGVLTSSDVTHIKSIVRGQ